MSIDSTDGATDESDRLARDDVLALVEDALRESARKVESGRVYDESKERVRQGWVKAICNCANSYRMLAADEDLDDLAERLDELERHADREGVDRLRVQ